jgi:hypothetical protein
MTLLSNGAAKLQHDVLKRRLQTLYRRLREQLDFGQASAATARQLDDTDQSDIFSLAVNILKLLQQVTFDEVEGFCSRLNH